MLNDHLHHRRTQPQQWALGVIPLPSPSAFPCRHGLRAATSSTSRTTRADHRIQRIAHRPSLLGGSGRTLRVAHAFLKQHPIGSCKILSTQERLRSLGINIETTLLISHVIQWGAHRYGCCDRIADVHPVVGRTPSLS